MVTLQDEGQCQRDRSRLCRCARQAQRRCLLLRPGNHFGGFAFGPAMCGLPPILAFAPPILLGRRDTGIGFAPGLRQADRDRLSFGRQAPAGFCFCLTDRFQQGGWSG
jgi:hypothetical protein